MSGTVATVDVAVGDKVGVGQKLATLDTTSLQASVDQSQAALDQAELTLEKALNGESVGGPSGTSGIQTIAFTPGATSSANGSDPELAAAQRAVVDAQQQVDKDLAAAQHALEAAEAACGSTSSSGSGSASESDSDGSTTTTTTTPAADDSSACATALDTALQAQQQLAASQNVLVQASNALDTLLAQRASTSGNTSQGSNNGGGANNGTGPAPTSGGANWARAATRRRRRI